MGVPKRKPSKSKMRARKASHRTAPAQTSVCAQCGARKLAHRVCPACGYYRGRQVVSVVAD